MSKKSYSDKLKDPRWQRKRLEILNRYDFICEDCLSGDGTLHVHHCLYLPNRDPWEYEDSELRALCEKCHARRAELEREAVLAFKRAIALKSVSDIRGIVASLLTETAECLELSEIDARFRACQQ